MDEMFSDKAPDFGRLRMGMATGTWWSDGGSMSRRRIRWRMLAANAHLAKGYQAGLKGVARYDCRLRRRGTEWRMRWGSGNTKPPPDGSSRKPARRREGDDLREESFGTGSDHVREKDGLWAILLWLNILAVRGSRWPRSCRITWAKVRKRKEKKRKYGRNYYSRHDFEAIATDKADAMMRDAASLAGLKGKVVEGMTVSGADDFAYTDPVDDPSRPSRALRVMFTDGSRIVLRLSGTGTEGATLRVYLERYVAGPAGLDKDAQEALAPVIRAAHDLARIAEFTGRKEPT